MNIGLSTACLYPMETEKAFAHCAAMGQKTVEIFFNAGSELSGPVFRQILELKDRYGILVPALHPFTSFAEGYFLFTRYERRFQDARDFYKRYFEAAQTLGAAVVTLHGDTKGALPLEGYCERYHILREDAKPFGVRLAQENVVHYRSGQPGFALQMRDCLKEDVDFVFDVKQAVRSGCDPFEVLGEMGKRVCHVHLSDHNPQHDCMVPGRGTFDFSRLFRELKGMEYHGSLVVELYRENFEGEEEIERAVQWLQRIVQKET